jgi:recombination protein RecR
MKLVKNLNLPINYLFRSFGTYGYLCAMQFPSKLIEDAGKRFCDIARHWQKKTALRLVMHLLQKEANDTKNLSEAILKMRTEIKFCKTCHNVSDEDICSICSNSYRDKSVVCIVENFRDIIAIENTRHYNGLYHVLEGLISPMDGIGPEQLNIHTLVQRMESGDVKGNYHGIESND